MKRYEDVLKKKIEDLKESIQSGYSMSIRSDLLEILEEIEKFLNSVELRKDVTQDYENMIYAFEFDFSAAFNYGDYNIFDDLKRLYESKNKRLLEDTKKLQELSFNLRHGICKIYQIDKEKS